MERKPNTRCPLHAECERKCAYEGHELHCDYYRNNAIGDLVIADQEEIREREERERMDEIYEEMLREEDSAETGHFVMLPIDQLHPHPDNPRKELGDLTELADSIKASGVFQNLTVVPAEDGYTIIIGHRRRAASELAGLTHLPCVIVEMTEKEQLATMLTENMQRSDLTFYEQAQGFQLMFELGESVETIADKSGFSKTTVRKRLEIAKLDKDALKSASARQLTMGDFDELAKLDDIDARNKLLKSIGTANFKNDLRTALQKERTRKRMQEWLEVIRTFATGDAGATSQTRRFVCSYGYWNTSQEVEVPENSGMVRYFYKISRDQIDIYKERNFAREDAERAAREERDRRANIRLQQFTDINQRHYDLRYDFVKNLSNATCREKLVAVNTFVASTIFNATNHNDYDKIDLQELADLLGIQLGCSNPEKIERITECAGVRSAIEAFPEKTMFCMAYCIADKPSNGYWRRFWESGQYNHAHKVNPKLDALYDVLERLGYEMSIEEEEMQFGEHAVFSPGYTDGDEDPEG